MKKIKKTLLFIFLFVSTFFIKNTVFGLTLNVTDYTELENFSGISPLTLKTTTSSYLVALSTDLKTVKIIEPYNASNYLALRTVSSAENGSYYCFGSYDVSSLSYLPDVICYETTNIDGSWGNWRESGVTNISSIAPGNNNYVYVDRCNISLYCDGIGIVGTECLSSGVPLPSGITFKDNISIISKGSKGTYLLYSSNSNNYLWNNNTYFHFLTSSGSKDNFSYYKYNSATNTFDYVADGTELHLLVNATSIFHYSYNDIASRF